MLVHEGTLYSGNTTNAITNFTVDVACTLVSAKVYTDTPGDRQIELRNGTTVLETVVANIPIDSSRVTLNFPLVPGITYSLATNATVNNQNFGYNSPRLQRSSTGVSYPYTIPNILSISGNNQGATWYYYFFDWEVKEPDFLCVSERVPVIADITTGIDQNPSQSSIQMFPNPANLVVTLMVPTSGATKVELVDVAGRLVQANDFNVGSEGLITLGLEGVAKGFYHVRIKNSDGETVKRLSVQ
jgi:hypothetical protein